MKYFDLKVGFACNNNCVHCVIAEKQKYGNESIDNIKSIIEQNKNIDNFIITGGEPTIRKDLIDILKYIKSLNCNSKIILQTNGRVLGANSQLAKEIENYVDIFVIAIHSNTKNIHNSIAGNNNAFDETINGIKNIYHLNKNKVITQTVISKLNSNHLAGICDFIQEIVPGVRMNITFPHPDGNAYLNFDDVVPTYTSIKDQLYLIFKKWGNIINSEAIPICYIVPFVFKVNYSESNLLENTNTVSGFDLSFKDKKINDYKKPILDEHIKSIQCKQCFYYNHCVGVWKEYYNHFGGEELKPIIKEKNKILIKIYDADYFFIKYDEIIQNLYYYADDIYFIILEDNCNLNKIKNFLKINGHNLIIMPSFDLIKKYKELNDNCVEIHNLEEICNLG